MRHQPFFLLLLAVAWLTPGAKAATLIVTNDGDFGAGTLADAIAAANVSPGPDVIRFNIQPPGPHIIYTADPIWTITDPVTIDGTTQPGYAGVPLIEFNSGAGWWSGLVVAASNCTIRGLSIVGGGADGIRLEASAHGTVIGGTNGAGNRIAFNGGNGVTVAGATNVSIRGNAIFANDGLGIDLDEDGVTPNDDKDPDEGANHLQNFPTLTTASYSVAGLAVSGSLNSRPSTAFTLDFYASGACDDSGNGEGEKHLGSTTITTANNGIRTFSVTLTSAPPGRFVTATATDPAGNTSEFSPCVRFSSSVTPTTFTVTNGNDSGPGSLRQAILSSNARFASGPNTIAFNIPGAGVRRILLTSGVLPQITEPAIIDGYTQPGSSLNTSSNAFNGVVRIRLDGILLGYGRAFDITAGSSTVRGLNIMNFAYAAVACDGAGSNTIAGNLIGITVEGEVGPTGSVGGSSYEASIVLSAAAYNLVGGTNADARNVVAGSGYGDLWLSGAASNRVSGNFFGCDTTGTNGIHALGFGIDLDDSWGNVIGGTNGSLRNVFLGHEGSDVLVVNLSEGNVVQGNFLGVGTDGLPALGEWGGISIGQDSSKTLVGGTNGGAGNVIAGSVAVHGGTGNAIVRNSMLGVRDSPLIDLGFDGPTPNDPDDSDTGANDLQNYPEILSAIRYPNRTVIRSRLQSIRSATYRIDFYDNDRPPPFGHAEARTWIGTTNVTLGVSGQTNFNWSPAATLTPGHWVTATATDATSNTSELAPAVVVALSNAVDLVVSLTAPAEPVSHTSNFTYTVAVRNLGPTNATGVVLSNFLPANVSFVSASTTQGSCAPAGGVVTCSLGGLTNGARATVTLTVQPLSNGVAELTARVSATQGEMYPPDNVATGGPFAGIADLAIVTGRFAPDSVTAGQPYDTLITITNRGPDAAFVRVEVDWIWPEAAVSITTTQGTVAVPYTTTYADTAVGTIAAGGSSIVAVHSLHTADGDGLVYIRVVHDGFWYDDRPIEFYGHPPLAGGPGVLTLDNALQQTGESDGSVALRVARYGGADGSVAVSYSTSNSSATAGADYIATSGTLTFAGGETEKFITVPVLDDYLPECGETFNVSLFNPTGGASFLLFGNTNCVVQILDNDPSLRGLVTGITITATNANATGDGFAETLSLSDDGRFVAFGSTARNLIAGNPAGSYDVFVRDLVTGTTTLASVNRFGTNGADNGAYQPQLSADGRMLAFMSPAMDLVTNDNRAGYQQVYLRDLASGTTRLLSTAATGSGAGAESAVNPLITSNGWGVAFHSWAANATAIPDANGVSDVFFRNAAAGVTHAVSVNRWGSAMGNGESFLPYFATYPGYRIAGRYVGFTSRASDLVAGDNNGEADVFVRDLTNGVTTLVSRNFFGTGSGNSSSFDPLVSADGRYALFCSTASDLVVGDTNETTDVFVRDLVSGVTRLASPNRFGTGSANGYSTHDGFSRDGRYALFISDASDLVATDRNEATDVFVRDLVAGITILVSQNCDGSASGNGRSDGAAISPDGRYVAFISDATDLVPGAGGAGHAYLRDLVNGTTTLLTANWRGGVSPVGGVLATAVANGAATVAFQSYADDLLPIDQNGDSDLFAWRALTSNTVDLVVEQVDSPDPVMPGSNLTYTVTVLNRGLTNASGVVLTDTLPAGATFLSAIPSQGSCGLAAGVVTCPLGRIDRGTLATVAITMVLPAPGMATNTASVTAAEPEAYPANNTKAETTALLALTDLAISVDGNADYIVPLQILNFLVTVTNRGPQNAGGVVVTSSLIPYVQVNLATASKGMVTVSGSQVRWSINTLAVNESATLALAVETYSLVDFIHVARVSFAGIDTVPLNNSASKSIGVRPDLGTMTLAAGVEVPEGCTAVFTLLRTGQTNGAVSVSFETADQDAVAGIDYVAQSGTLNFADGETVRTIRIQTLLDPDVDPGENFRVHLLNPVGGAVIGWPDHAYGTIQPPNPSMLSISRASGQVLISTWPCAPAACVLEGGPSLPGGAGWTALSATVLTSGDTRTFVVPIDSPFRFFRLRCP